MDAQESSPKREKCSPEAITSTGLTVIYEPEMDAPIVDIVFVHGLKGHPYKTWRCQQTVENAGGRSTDPRKEALKSSNSKRLELRRSLKAFLKGSSSNNRQDTSLTESTCHKPKATEIGDLSVFWPADLLPQLCKKARILTFGYDTKITKFTSGPTNTNSIFSHGKDFLFSLGRECVWDRPIIFIAHSLGGILVKEMLALSSTSNTPAHRGVIRSTAAVIFLGTPHRGSPELSAIGEWARSLLSSLKLQTTSIILDTLGLKTTDLERAHEAFCRLWYQYDFQVKTFQESLGLTGIDLGVLGNKVVPHESSLIGDPREQAETLQANHSQMSRFRSAQDPNFIKVAGEIKRFYAAINNANTRNLSTEEANGFLEMRTGSNSDSLHKEDVPEILEKTVLVDFLAALRFDGMNTRRDAILAPAMNTGNWLFQSPTFHRWTSRTDINYHLLFIKGKPGAGKSTLMKEAVRSMQRVQGREGICASFFVHAGGELLQRCPAGIFRSLLYQLLLQSRLCNTTTHMNPEKETLICSIKDAVLSTLMPSRDWSERLLEVLLTKTLRYLASLDIPVFIFVDALDELSIETQRQQVDFWSLQQLYFQGPRICLSCRHFPNITVAGCLELALDTHNQKDILNYITQRLDARISAQEGHWRKTLTEKIYTLSSGIFLWVVLVVDETLARYDRGTSLFGLVRRVEEMPTELEKLYEKILTTSASGDSIVVGKMFQWALAANRPLHLDEWYHILAFIQVPKPDSLSIWQKSDDFTENDDQLERKIKSLSRGLLEVSAKQQDVLADKNGEVSSIHAGAGSLDHEEGSARVVRVIHQSVYDFFIHKGGFQSLGLKSADPLVDCHCTIVNTCFDYLFIPELDEYVVARQRRNMASPVSASLHSEVPIETEEPPEVDFQRNRPSSGHGFEGLETLHPCWRSLDVVMDWLAVSDVSSYTGILTGSSKQSASRESFVAAASQVLDDYPALLIYAVTEVMLHIEIVEEARPTRKVQELITRLGDDAIWKRLRALQQDKHARKRTAQWLDAIAQHEFPPAHRVSPKYPPQANGPRSPRSIASFSSASSFSHNSWGSHTDTKRAKIDLNELRRAIEQISEDV